MKMHVDFCLPVKNEELVIESTLEKLLEFCRRADFKFSWRIIGLINGSTDQTAEIFKAFRQRFPEEVDFEDSQQPGRGRALRNYWSRSRADILVYMDADLSVALENIPSLVIDLANNDFDLAIGSRLLSGSSVERSWYRELVSRSYNFLSRLLLRHRFADLQCGFKAIRREAYEKISPWLRDDYWFFDTELVVLAACLGYRVKEVPVDWRENRYEKRMTKVKILRDSLKFLNDLRNFRRRLGPIRKGLYSA